MKLISIDEKWPTEKDTDKNGKIWVYRIPSMTKWDRTGELFKISLEQYIEPLNLEIIHLSSRIKKLKVISLFIHLKNVLSWNILNHLVEHIIIEFNGLTGCLDIFYLNQPKEMTIKKR